MYLNLYQHTYVCLCLHFKQVETRVPPPSFCYILSAHPSVGQIDVIEEDRISKLYQPPVTRFLREILQVSSVFLIGSLTTFPVCVCFVSCSNHFQCLSRPMTTVHVAVSMPE